VYIVYVLAEHALFCAVPSDLHHRNKTLVMSCEALTHFKA